MSNLEKMFKKTLERFTRLTYERGYLKGQASIVQEQLEFQFRAIAGKSTNKPTNQDQQQEK